jgi:hypothetical protein
VKSLIESVIVLIVEESLSGGNTTRHFWYKASDGQIDKTSLEGARCRKVSRKDLQILYQWKALILAQLGANPVSIVKVWEFCAHPSGLNQHGLLCGKNAIIVCTAKMSISFLAYSSL